MGKYYTIKKRDVGKRTIKAFGKVWLVSDFLGLMFDQDVGKIVYERGGILQVESSEQMAKRIGTVLDNKRTTQLIVEEWATSRDAVPAGHVQVTVYEVKTGKRVATVFEREDYVSLIAAAPDLLAALEDVREWCDLIEHHYPEMLFTKKVRAAIAKAEGWETT